MKTSRVPAIAYVISMPHGMEPWTYREVQALTESGMRVILFPIKHRSGPYMPHPEWECHSAVPWLSLLRQPVHLIRHPGLYLSLLCTAIMTRSLADFALAWDFAPKMSAANVRMIHSVFGDHKLFVAYFCKRILGIPLSTALYGYDLRFNPNWTMFRKAVREADEIVVNCDFNRRLLSELAGQDVAERAHVIRHYANTQPNPATPPRRTVALMVGRFEERKGHDVLFQALKQMGSHADGLEVWVVGIQGTVDVRQLAVRYGVESRVRVLGAVSDEVLELLYQRCDLFCLPSRTDHQGVSEGLPVALIEAMAHGKPVISTRIAGIPELVEEMLVDEGDAEGLADALTRLSSDQELRGRLGKRNLDIVETRYSKSNLDAMRVLFQSALDVVATKPNSLAVGSGVYGDF